MSSTTYEPITEIAPRPSLPGWVGTVGRNVFAVPMLVFGAFHLMAASQMAAAVPAWVPGGGTFWVVVTGLGLIAAGISLITNRLTTWSGPLLALLLLTFAVTLHLPGVIAGDQAAMPGFLKDTALAGAALAFGLRR